MVPASRDNPVACEGDVFGIAYAALRIKASRKQELKQQ